MIIRKINLTHFDLRRSPPVERRAVIQDLTGHHVDERSAQDQHHVFLAQELIPYLLENGREGGVCLSQILKLIYHEDDPGLLRLFCDHLKDRLPLCEACTAKQPVLQRFRNQLLKCVSIFPFALFRCQKIDGPFPLAETIDQGGFPHSSTSIYDDKRSPLSLVFFFQNSHLLLTVYEFFHRDASLHCCHPGYAVPPHRTIKNVVGDWNDSFALVEAIIFDAGI